MAKVKVRYIAIRSSFAPTTSSTSFGLRIWPPNSAQREKGSLKRPRRSLRSAGGQVRPYPARP
jgi:hypothetical protein